MKQQRVFPTGWDASLSQGYLFGFPNHLLAPFYTPGWRGVLQELNALPKNTMQCPLPGLEPGLLDSGGRAQK